jgi:pimeloyl-ACP methyl ester carboxylesterase
MLWSKQYYFFDLDRWLDAHDQVGLMRQLGFQQFQLVGHDRGARIAHRLVLDHPEAVTRLAILDILPTHHALSHLTRTAAAAGSRCHHSACSVGRLN